MFSSWYSVLVKHIQVPDFSPAQRKKCGKFLSASILKYLKAGTSLESQSLGAGGRMGRDSGLSLA